MTAANGKPARFNLRDWPRGFRIKPEILQPSWYEAALVAEFGDDDHAIPIEKPATPT